MSEGMPKPDQTPKRRFEKDLEFHEEKWEERAEEANNERSILHIVSNSPEKTAEDFMYKEALRDNDDHIKQIHEEYGKWEELAAPTRARFLERAAHPERTDIVTVAVIPPGGMKAAGPAGAVLAASKMGIKGKALDYIFGASSGLMVATEFETGEEDVERGISLMEGPLADKKFINTRRPGNTIDLQYLKGLLDSGEYALDVNKIKEAHPQLWGIVTNPIEGRKGTAKAELFNMKTLKEGISSGIVSSMSIPGVTGEIPTVNGQIKYDGGFDAIPIDQIVDKVTAENPGKEINILIFMQGSFEPIADMKPSRTEAIAARVMRDAAGPLFKGLGSLNTGAIVNQLASGLVLKQKQRESMEAIMKAKGVNIGINWAPANDLYMTSIDGTEMKSAVYDSFRHTYDLFGVEQPAEVPEYISELQRQDLHEAIANFTANKAA